MDCKYLIQPQCGKVISLTFDKFTIDTNDVVIVYKGATTSDSVLLNLDGSKKPPIDPVYSYNGSIVNFSSCIANNLTIAGNPNNVSLRISFLVGTNQFYSPLVIPPTCDFYSQTKFFP
jgi:hypothetical protein